MYEARVVGPLREVVCTRLVLLVRCEKWCVRGSCCWSAERSGVNEARVVGPLRDVVCTSFVLLVRFEKWCVRGSCC